MIKMLVFILLVFLTLFGIYKYIKVTDSDTLKKIGKTLIPISICSVLAGAFIFFFVVLF